MEPGKSGILNCYKKRVGVGVKVGSLELGQVSGGEPCAVFNCVTHQAFRHTAEPFTALELTEIAHRVRETATLRPLHFHNVS